MYETKLRFHDLHQVFTTWLYNSGVSKSIVGEMLGHKDEGTTDRYITRDRLSKRNVLDFIPRIERKTKKETHKNESLIVKSGKNWQGRGKEHITILPKKAVNS
ncbi:tyrosine-type recombinase/integrase [candidate division KSB1 bacterium]